MRRPIVRRADRVRIVAILAAAFVAGAMVIFALVNVVGTLSRIAEIPVQWRLGIAGAGLLALATLDLLAIRASTYCPLGWRRQTPRRLMRRYRLEVVSAVWGFDTGLAVTTFRVAAVTWAALLLVGLGLSPWWAGTGYGFGFALPFLYLIWAHRAGSCSRDSAPVDPGLESLLGRRSSMQAISAALLAAAGGVLLIQSLV